MKNIAYKFGLLIASMLLMLMAASGVAWASSQEDGEGPVQMTHGYQVMLVFANPAQVGENRLHLRVSDVQGQPVTHAEVTVSVIVNNTVEHGDAGHGEAEPSQDTHDSSADSETHSSGHSETDAHGGTNRISLEQGETHGEYAGDIIITQVGSWIIRTYLTIDGTPMTVDFPVTVAASSQNGLGILTSFVAVNASILSTAAILRIRKQTKTPQH